MEDELEGYLDFAKGLAAKAAVIAKRHFKIGVKADFKADNSPVTVADTEINQLVIDEVKKAYPGHDIMGEEASHLVNHGDYVWVCDPIDGTNAYEYGLPYSCFMLALVYKGDPVVAVINDVFSDRLYWAVKGRGSFLNGQKVAVGRQNDIAKSVITASGKTSRLVDTPRLRQNLETACHRMMILMCCSQEALLVANGQIAGGIYVGYNAHDSAAPKLLIEEAGGKVTDLLGRSQRYDGEVKGQVYSNGLVHDQLLEVVRTSLL